MGVLKNGPFGVLNGKVGNLVSYELLGKNVTRIAGANNAAASKGQLVCRRELAVVIAFLKPVNDFIRVGFMQKAAELNLYPHNVAVSVNKLNALIGVYPDLAINYSKVLVAQGVLRVAEQIEVVRLADGIRFTWDAEVQSADERMQTVMLMAYFPALGEAIYSINGAKRHVGTELLLLDEELINEGMELYISFISVPDNNVSDSVYAGKL